MLVIVLGDAVLAVPAQRDVAGVQLEAADLSYAVRSVPEDLRRQVDHPAAPGALRVQVLVHGRRLDHVVRREAAVEMYVAEHSRCGETVERPVHRRPMDTSVAERDLVENFLG